MKRAQSLELSLKERDPSRRAHDWLYGAVREEILAGRLRPGTRLPATRDLARQYHLARGTVVNAFEQLKAEGYVESRVGSGTRVSKILPEHLLQAGRVDRAAASPRTVPHRNWSRFAARVALFPNFGNRRTRAFRANLPALDLFPAALWAQIAARRLHRVSTSLLLGCDAMGYPPLRRAVADYLVTSRGARCTAGQVAIVSGVQEAVDLTARLLLDPGDRVCMENPGYVGASAVFNAVGARVIPLRVDEEGMVLRANAMRRARLAYVTPGHQFPLGITMSLSRRLQLLEWARKTGAMILEDDYDSEYRYAGRPAPTLQGLDRDALVLFTGSFSKVLFPSLRLGYLVVPPDLIDRLAATISVTTRHAPLLDQAILADFMELGHFGRHVRRMRQIYAERLRVLQECARQHWKGLLEIAGVEAGLQTAAWLSDGLNGERCAAAAAKGNVEVTPLSEYAIGKPVREGLQMGFAAIDEREIRRGARDLASVLEAEWRRSRRQFRRP